MADLDNQKFEKFTNDLEAFRELVLSVEDSDEISLAQKMVSEYVNGLDDKVFFNLDAQRNINKFLSETREKLGFSNMIDTFLSSDEDRVKGFNYGNLAVLFFDSPYNFVLPDSYDFPSINGDGSGKMFEQKPLVPRIKLMYELLKDLGISSCIVFDGVVADNQFRRIPYVLFVIEEISKAVLLCEEFGNRTFVKSGLSDLENFSFSSKSTLKKRADVRHFVWRGKEDFNLQLLDCFLEENSDDNESEMNVQKYPKMNKEYFTKENVVSDLDSFSELAGLGGISKLNIGNLQAQLEVVCANGEKVFFRTYLVRARVALGLFGDKLKPVLNELKVIYGAKVEDKIEYPLMDKEYFTKENVLHDLEAYCSVLNLKSVRELNTSIKKTQVVCANGEKVYFRTYLVRAAVSLGFSIDKLKFVLNELKKICSLEEILEYPSMNRAYFTKENVEHDLDAYFEVSGLRSIEEINTVNCNKKKVVCANGEKVYFQTYITRACTSFGFRRFDLSIGLNELKKIYGLNVIEREKFSKMNKAYFTKENIIFDLDSYCKVACLNSVAEITTGNREEVVCANGEEVIFSTYLARACVSLGFNKSEWAFCLNELKKIYGLKVKEIMKFPKMDKDYFTKANVVHDLDSFYKTAELNSVEDLNIGEKCRNTEIICANGEKLDFGKYIGCFRNRFGLSKSKFSIVFTKLKKIYGFMVDELSEYPIIDREYFTKDNVRFDLDSFCKIAGLNSIEDLNTHNCKDKKIECANGIKINFLSYLNRVNTVFGLVRNTRLPALIELKKIYGLEVEEILEYPKMDELYFTKENIIHDLDNYCKALGFGLIEELNIGIKCRNTEVVCANGETVSFKYYLRCACVVFGHSVSRLKYALNDLISVYKGEEIVKSIQYSDMDFAYFTQENIVNDLDAYSKSIGLNSIEKLNTSNCLKKEVVCANGETVSFKAYLRRACDVFACSTLRLVLIKLKSIFKGEEV